MTDAARRLELALAPRSVAIVGASPRPNSLSLRFLAGLERHGFPGRVAAVNPKYEQVGGFPCVPAIAEAGEIDLAVLSVAKQRVLETLEECAAARVAGALVFASGYSETGEGREGEAEIAALARRTGLRVIGPNSPGLINITRSCCVIASGVSFRSELVPGAVALVAQSGGVAGLLVERAQDARVGLSTVVCTGNEADVRMGEVLDALARDEATRAVGVFVEGVRDGDDFVRGLRSLRAAGKPAVVFKAGSTPAAARASAAHTGALVTDADVFGAVLEREGAIAVHSLDDLLETTTMLERLGPAATPRVGIVTTSGGAGVVAAEAAERSGLELPGPPASTRAALAAAMPDFASPSNPTDMSGMFVEREEIFRDSLAAFLEAREYDAVVLVLTVQPTELADVLVDRIVELGDTAAPLVVLWIAGALSAEARARLRHAGTVVSEDPDRCMRALAARAAGGSAPEPVEERELPDVPAVLEAARRRGAALEHEALAALAEVGIPVAETRLVVSAAEAGDAAVAMGGAVAVKAAARDLPHKDDAGAVALGVEGADAAASAYERVVAAAERAGADPEGAVVQRQTVAGRELIVGARRDPLFGPVLVAGEGGTGVEVIGRTEHRLLPLQRGEADRLATGLGAPAAAAAISGLASLALALGDELDAVEVNPLIVAEGSVTAVDALILLARARTT